MFVENMRMYPCWLQQVPTFSYNDLSILEIKGSLGI